MGYEEWEEDVVIGEDDDGSPIYGKKTFHKITCDRCGKEVENSRTKVAEAYVKVGTGDSAKYYCHKCYVILRAKGEL